MTSVAPSFPEFKRLARRYNVIPLYREIVVDRETPVSVYDRLRQGEPYAFLLESVEGGERIGRYSFVGRCPQAVFSCLDGRVRYSKGKSEKIWKTTNPLQDLKKLFKQFRAPDLPGLPRFWGGAVGYWDYDTVRFFERLPRTPAGQAGPDGLGLPGGLFQFSGEGVIFDRLEQTAKVMVCVFVPEGKFSESALRTRYQAGTRALERQIDAICSRSVRGRVKKGTLSAEAKPLGNRQAYLDAVEKAKEYICAGDIIQVVLSQRWVLQGKTDPLQVYRALRLVNPSPYMYCLHFPEVDIVGSSPEVLVRKEGDHAETRPIAGTRPRGRTPEDDQRLADELQKDPKERAEHLMLVDLGRNDLGRVCEPGTVRVPEFMITERYSHVMHLVSSVTGKLSAKSNAFDLFQACFPAGTVAGAPKIRAMEIIDELEPVRRGPYAGAVGYFSYTGNMDMAITIRTLIMKGSKAYLQAGAGIVADSVPEREYQECEHKAAALLKAVEKARKL